MTKIIHLVAGQEEAHDNLLMIPTLSSTSGIIFKGANRFIHNFQHPTGDGSGYPPYGYNVFIGENAGNFTSGATATQFFQARGSYNIGVGYQSLLSLTSGFHNLCLGHLAGEAITSASRNTALGSLSLQKCTTGSYNFGCGMEALTNLTTGAYNTSLGYQSGFNLLTGVRNIYLGYQAAGYVGTSGYTKNETSTDCIAIGSESRLSADGVTNEMVFGYQTVGSGSNTCTLGNSNITNTILRGAVSGVNITLSDLTASQALMTDAAKKIVSVDYLNQAVKNTSSPTFAGLTVSSLTAGRITFASTAGLLADDSLLVWDNVNKRIGVGTSSPIAPIHLSATSFPAMVLYRTGSDNMGGMTFYSGAGGSGEKSMSLGYRRTEDAMLVLNTATAPIFTVTNAGAVGIGITAPTAPLHIATAGTGDYSAIQTSGTNTVNVTGSSNLAVNGLLEGTTTTGTINTTGVVYVRGGYYLPTLSATITALHSGSIFTGFQNVPLFSGTGILPLMAGFRTYLAVNNASATVTTGSAVRIASPYIVAGAITTTHGLYIESQKPAGVTTSYGIYQLGASDTNYFAANVGIGTSAPAYKLDVYTQNNTTSGSLIGLNSAIYSTPAGSSSAIIVGAQFTAEKNGAQNLTGAWGSGGLVGGIMKAVNRNTGTVTNAYGFVPDVQNITAGGTITNSHTLYIPNPYVAAGAITNAYGIYLASITSGGTLNYSIYSAGGSMYHAGNVGIGTTVPTSKLHITSTTAAATTVGMDLTHRNNGAATSVTGGKTSTVFANGTSAYMAGHEYQAAIYATSAHTTVNTSGHGLATRLVLYGTTTYNASITQFIGLNVQDPVITMGSGSGTATNIYGIRVYNQGFAGATNSYGLYLNNQTGASTLNYAIYSAGGDSYHAGTWQAGAYKSSDGSTGATGSFTTADLKTVTVKNGLITDIT